jgi:hypothetical protein
VAVSRPQHGPFEKTSFVPRGTCLTVDHLRIPLDPHISSSQRRLRSRNFLAVQDCIVWNFRVTAQLRVKIQAGMSWLGRFPRESVQQQCFYGSFRIFNHFPDEFRQGQFFRCVWHSIPFGFSLAPSFFGSSVPSNAPGDF